MLLANAASAVSQSAPRFELSADTALVDEVVQIALTGLPPRQHVTVRMLAGGPARLHSSATFRSDERGVVDIGRMSPVAGDYQGVHAMGLFWSADRDATVRGPVPQILRTAEVRLPPPQMFILSAELDGRVVATDTVIRRAAPPDVRVMPLNERGLVGVALYPPGHGPHPAMIVLGGSQGGIPALPRFPAGLVSQGYAVLALGYFGAAGLPERLLNIPLEYFETAIRWLSEQPSVDSTRLGVLGISRGGELALLLGATFPSVRTVVAYVPSHVAWRGMQIDAARTPAWTFRGMPIPFMSSNATPQAVARHAGCSSGRTCSPRTVHQFMAMLDDNTAEARAEIPIERINGPVLLISGSDDQLWPSALMADRAFARLKRNNFRYPFVHLKYDGAGHAISRPHFPTRGVTELNRHPVLGVLTTPGGTAEGTALANEDSWRKLLQFLDRNLKVMR
jgi:dienelactone hydrolase